MKKFYVSPLFAELELELEDVLFDSALDNEMNDDDDWGDSGDFDDEDDFNF
jgi:hypothetical protein